MEDRPHESPRALRELPYLVRAVRLPIQTFTHTEEIARPELRAAPCTTGLPKLGLPVMVTQMAQHRMSATRTLLLVVAASLSLAVSLAAAADYDADGDGTISRDEALAAVEEYLFHDTITRAETLEIIEAYLFAIPVGPPVLVLSASAAAVEGYWSDGTADVAGTITMASEDGRPIVGDQPVEATCAEPATCHWQVELSTDGVTEASTAYRLRVPMGTTVVTFSYGDGETLAHTVSAPERIIVSRDAWDCYVDRELDPTLEDSLGNKNFYGCSGWRAADAVHKMRGDSPVRLWVTSGAPRYLELLRESLTELGTLLNLAFEWVEQQGDGVLNVYTGIPRSAWADYGLVNITEDDLETGGWAVSSITAEGEVTPEEVVVWRIDSEWHGETRAAAKSVILHELLHVLTGVAHVATRPAAMMGYLADLPKLSPTDTDLFRLNSHPLVRPGMSLQEVGSLLTFEEDLLDYADLQPDTLEKVWQAADQLVEAGTVRFHLSGGNIVGGEGCQRYQFGTVENPAVLTLSDFPRFVRSGASTAAYEDSTGRYRLRRDEGGWGYERARADGGWESLSRDALDEAVHWWPWANKLPYILYTLLSDGQEEAIAVTQKEKTITLRFTTDAAAYPTWHFHDTKYDIALVLDTDTHEVVGYTVRKHPQAGRCTYAEIAQAA